MTDSPSRADLGVVVAALDRVDERIDEAKAQSKRTADRSRNLAAVAILVGLLGCFVGVRGFLVGQGAQDAIDTANEVRATARVSSCEQAVDFAVAHNDLVRRNQAMLERIAAGSTNPETQQFVEEEVAAFQGNIVLVRDCSPSGIEAFSNGDGGYLPAGVTP